jgi:hypothetical protein
MAIDAAGGKLRAIRRRLKQAWAKDCSPENMDPCYNNWGL